MKYIVKKKWNKKTYIIVSKNKIFNQLTISKELMNCARIIANVSITNWVKKQTDF